MTNPPQTREEAERTWSNFHEFLCSYAMTRYMALDNGKRGRVQRQCLRKPGHGPGGLYCDMHARKVEGRQ